MNDHRYIDRKRQMPHHCTKDGDGRMGAAARTGLQDHRRPFGLRGKDEGAPGVRGETEPPFYGAYVRDPEGNKFCAYYKG